MLMVMMVVRALVAIITVVQQFKKSLVTPFLLRELGV